MLYTDFPRPPTRAAMIRTFHGFHHGHNTASPTDTLRASLRASLRFFPRARTEAGEWRRKPHVKVPSPRTAARRMCAADVPTDFLRSAANWRQGVHSERGKESTRSAAFFAQVHLATNCRARFPASGGASRLPREKLEGQTPRKAYFARVCAVGSAHDSIASSLAISFRSRVV